MKKSSGSSIMGVGNDIIEISRIKAVLDKEGDAFLKRLFTPLERDYFLSQKDPLPSIAGRFSAKEAVAKALGTGITQELSWKDIEILNNPSGKPEVFFSQRAKEKFDDPVIFLSISHCKLYATAVAIWA